MVDRVNHRPIHTLAGRAPAGWRASAAVSGIYIVLPGISHAQAISDSLDVLSGGYGSTEIDFFMSLVKVAVALAFTLALLVAAVWFLKRFLSVRSVPGLSGGSISILELQYIGPRKSIALVRIAERVFIIGISDQSMSTLGELSPDDIAKLPDNTPSSAGFSSILKRFTRSGDESVS